jgi:hypothetical protein
VATPDELDALSANLRGAYEAAWLDITTEQARIVDDPARYARRARLRELQAMVDDRLDQVDELAASWLADEFPTAYRLGAETTAGVLDQPFRWTTNDNDAVTLLAQDTFDELLAATDGVSDSTKRLIRRLGKEQALLKAAAGKTATQAARQLRRLLEQQGIFSLRYKDGSRHGLADYTDMLLRTKTGVAHNAGGLNFARRAGTRWVEVFDGFDCGWFTHDDNDKANRSIRTVEEAAKATLSHPRCRRSFGPRPDITNAEQAKTAKSSITDAQQANQTAAERARAAGQRERAAARRRQASARTRRAAERDARAAAQTARRTQREAQARRAGRQGDLELERLPPLPRVSTLPHDADGLTPEQLAKARKELPKLKAQARANAADVRDEAQFALDAADAFQMAPPYAKGSIEARQTGAYDWFYQLHPDEQLRLRQGWMKGHRQTASPDQIAERIGNFYGAADYDESIARWLDETRRYDAAGALQRGKIPAESRYGDLDLDGTFGDGTYHVRDIFDSDPDTASRSVAATTKEQAEEFAARSFVRPSGDRPAPYEMSEAEYVDELTAVEARAAEIRPIRSDPEFGDEYAPEDQAVFRRIDELVPWGIEGAEALPANVLYWRVRDMATEAGLA